MAHGSIIINKSSVKCFSLLLERLRKVWLVLYVWIVFFYTSLYISSHDRHSNNNYFSTTRLILCQHDRSAVPEGSFPFTVIVYLIRNSGVAFDIVIWCNNPRDSIWLVGTYCELFSERKLECECARCQDILDTFKTYD